MDILVDDDQRVLHLTLNRPAKRNALTLEMCQQIVAAVRAAESRTDVGCILITANGSAFCSGMDLDEAALSEDVLKAHEELFTIGANAIKPLVIAVNGAALGGGLGLVAQGHVVLAAPHTILGMPEVRLGLWPFVIYRAVETALGPRRALQLSLTGNSFHEREALEWGLIHQICPEGIEEVSRTVARNLARSSPLAIAYGMKYVREATGRSASDAGAIAAGLRAKLMESGDFKEGLKAFKEKREPHWPSMPRDFYASREDHS